MNRCLVNPSVDPQAVPPPSRAAEAFHASLPGYRPTPLRELPGVAGPAGAGGRPGGVETAAGGGAGRGRGVTDGYATLFSERAARGKSPQAILVPVGVGSLAAAAARYAAAAGVRTIGVEPVTAA